MNKQALKLNDTVVGKKDFYASKKAIPLNSVTIKSIVVFYRVKHSYDSHRHFIDGVIGPL